MAAEEMLVSQEGLFSTELVSRLVGWLVLPFSATIILVALVSSSVQYLGLTSSLTSSKNIRF
jgi:hypothetical protein